MSTKGHALSSRPKIDVDDSSYLILSTASVELKVTSSAVTSAFASSFTNASIFSSTLRISSSCHALPLPSTTPSRPCHLTLTSRPEIGHFGGPFTLWVPLSSSRIGCFVFLSRMCCDSRRSACGGDGWKG